MPAGERGARRKGELVTRILYVDDEDDIREVAVMSLELDPDFDVRACASAAEMLEVAPDWKPALVLLDVMMPMMDGPTAFRKLRTVPGFGDIPVVFITARTQPQEVAELKELGASGVIRKPFDPMTLAATVREHLA
jgi:CheY-like chemotaxis protein